MGTVSSRQNVGVEEVDISTNQAYRYPSKSGNYFSNHFIMGGERFETAYPEMYLFGENMDLNFLGSRPSPFPYSAPASGVPSRTLKTLVNIRKESLRFVRVPDDSVGLKEESKSSPPSTLFNIEFTFDCDVRCAITILYFCTEEVTSNGLVYTPKDPTMNSETYHYKRGPNQQFSQVSHVFDPLQHSEENLTYSFDKDLFPVVIYCVAEEGEEPFQAHATIAVIEKHSDGFFLKPLKQKIFIDGLCYLLQEIYGIENKNTDSKVAADEQDENGAECVICMCDLRDTLILPCRHLCLCNCCADSLRYQANNCPICRAPFRALLQIKSLQKVTPGAIPPAPEAGENIPPGYEPVSLIEALNGPSVTPQQPVAPAAGPNMYVQLPQNAAEASLHSSLEDRLSDHTMLGKDFKYDIVDESGKALPGMTFSHSMKGPKKNLDKSKSSDFSLNKCSDPVSTDPDGLFATSLPSASRGKLKKKKSADDALSNSESASELNQVQSSDGMDSANKKRWKKSSLDSSVYLPFPPNKLSESTQNAGEDTEEMTETFSLLQDLKITMAEAFSLFEDLKVSDVDRPQEADPSECESEFEESSSTTAPLETRNDVLTSADSYHPLQKSNSFVDDCSGLQSDSPNVTNSEESPSSIQDVEMPSNVAVSMATAENQSLPGTPLSRSSDVSANSASSSRPLIKSTPSHFSTTV